MAAPGQSPVCPSGEADQRILDQTGRSPAAEQDLATTQSPGYLLRISETSVKDFAPLTCGPAGPAQNLTHHNTNLQAMFQIRLAIQVHVCTALCNKMLSQSTLETLMHSSLKRSHINGALQSVGIWNFEYNDERKRAARRPQQKSKCIQQRSPHQLSVLKCLICSKT